MPRALITIIWEDFQVVFKKRLLKEELTTMQRFCLSMGWSTPHLFLFGLQFPIVIKWRRWEVIWNQQWLNIEMIVGYHRPLCLREKICLSLNCDAPFIVWQGFHGAV